MKRMEVKIDGNSVRINDVIIFGVHDIEIGDNYVLLKKDSENLIHFIDHEKEIFPYFTVIRIRDGERLAHNYKYCNFNPTDILAGYHKKVL